MELDLKVVDHLLTTTRSVRRRLDLTRPVEPEVIQECLEIAIQAPTGSYAQNWRFMVVTDPEKRARLAELYRAAFREYIQSKLSIDPYLPEDDPRMQRLSRITRSAIYLAKHLHEVPVHIIPCIEGRAEHGDVLAQATLYGSILPAAWSLMLALRARGLGAAWTTLHLAYEKEAAALLGIPEDVTQAALLPVAYFKGKDFRPGRRIPARELTYWDTWGRRR